MAGRFPNARGRRGGQAQHSQRHADVFYEPVGVRIGGDAIVAQHQPHGIASRCDLPGKGGDLLVQQIKGIAGHNHARRQRQPGDLLPAQGERFIPGGLDSTQVMDFVHRCVPYYQQVLFSAMTSWTDKGAGGIGSMSNTSSSGYFSCTR